MEMCGYNMPDVLNAVIKNTPGDSTYFQITSYSITPRTDVQGSTITMHLFLHLASSLGDDPGVPSAERWFKGTVGGHAFSFMWKAAATYMASGDYQWDVSFNTPYIYGTVSTNLYCCNGNNATGTSSTPVWGTSYTMNATAAVLPECPVNLTFNGIADVQTLAYYTAGTFAWSAPSNGGTGGTRSYNVYYVTTGGAWTYLFNTTATSVTLDPATYSITRGNFVSFNVTACNIYGAGPVNGMSYPTMYAARRPTACTVFSVPPAAVPYKNDVTIAWSGATAGDGTLTTVELYVQHCPKGGVWTGYAALGPVAYNLGAWTVSPYGYLGDFKAAPGSLYRFGLIVGNSYGLYSDFQPSLTVLMKGGIMRVKVAGVWRSGTAFIKVNGVWKEASSIYTRVNGVWKESI